MYLQLIIRLVMQTSCRGRIWALLLRYLAAMESVSCRVAADIFSWSQTIITYSTISIGKVSGLTLKLFSLMISEC